MYLTTLTNNEQTCLFLVVPHERDAHIPMYVLSAGEANISSGIKDSQTIAN